MKTGKGCPAADHSIPGHWLWAGAAIVLATALGAAGAAAASAVTAEADIGSLQLHFDAPMLTWQQPQTSAAIRLSPPVQCRWYWEDASTLRCEAAEYGKPLLAPATQYQVELGEGLWTQAGAPLPAQQVMVSTAPPALSASLERWDDGDPVVELLADQPVDSEAVREVLRLRTAQGQLLPFVLEPQPAPPDESRWWLRVDPAQVYSGVLSLGVEPGLRGLHGPLRGTQRQVLLSAHRHEPFQVYGVSCGWAATVDCVPGSAARLRFSRRPDAAALARWLRDLPAGLSAQPLQQELLIPDRVLGSYRPGWALPLDMAVARRHYRLELPAGFAAADGSRLAAAATVSFTSGDYPPLVRIDEAATVVLPGAKLTRAGEYRNAGPLKGSWRSFDADWRSGSETLPARGGNRSAALPLPVAQGQRRSGGLVSGDFGGHAGAFQVIHAPFQLVALYAQGQLLVWAGAWEAGAVQQDIELEIFHDNGLQPPTPLARGRTAADGTALISVPEPPADAPLPQLLLRARRDSQFSILPLSTYTGGARGGSTEDPYWGAPAPRLSWGVSDRPLYRPGERVQYRLWLRRREANRLTTGPAAGPVLLRLQSQWGEEVLPGWQGEADASGSISGELQIPAAATDGRHCIVAEGWPGAGDGGLCFVVANYYPTPLWARIEQAPALAVLGDDVSVDVAAGFYSGGPAAAAQVELSGSFSPLRLEAVFPEWKDYVFIHPRYADGGFGGGLAQRGVLDAQGRLQLRWQLGDAAADDEPDAQAAFGELSLIAAASTSPAQRVASAPLPLRVSRYRHFVGLKLEPLADAAGEVELTAVLIDAAGQAVAGAGTIEVHVEAVQASGDTAPPAQGRCVLTARQPSRCDLRVLPAGEYTFTASQGDAAPVSLRHRLGIASPARAAQLEALLQRLPDRDGKIQIQLQQPYAKARVLFAVQHQRILRHWVAQVDEPVHAFALDLPVDWAPGVTLSALVLDAELLRRPRGAVFSAAVQADIDLSIAPAAAPSPLQLQVPAQARPGGEIALQLHNSAAQPLEVTLAVTDESVRQQAPEILALQDPAGASLLGSLRHWSAADWQAQAAWKLLVPGMDGAIADPAGGEVLESIVVTGSRIRRVDLETSAAPLSLAQPPRIAVRRHFADTAHWQLLRIAPGATETVRFRLPDNLTRWQVSAWSLLGDARFHLDQASITSSLPLELRAETPAHLYVGDRGVLGVAARNAGAEARDLVLDLAAQGAGAAPLRQRGAARVEAARELRVAGEVRPAEPGELEVNAQVRSGADADALAVALPVASTRGRERTTVAGWLQDGHAALQLPRLPASARDVRLRLHLGRGFTVALEEWITALARYPHRCWEQTLSRAVGAGLALRRGRAAALWPDAETVVAQSLALARSFQTDGLFGFFPASGQGESGDVLLTAYSLQVFTALDSWGHAPDEGVLQDAHKALRSYLDRLAGEKPAAQGSTPDWTSLSAALAALPADAGHDVLIERADAQWSTLDVFAQSRLVLAMHARGTRFAQLPQRLAALRGTGVARADARRLESTRDRGRWMGSDLRDQCALIDTLQRIDAADPALPAWRRGVIDLYAGGGTEVDTQAAAQCLLALAGADETAPLPLAVQARLGGVRRDANLQADSIVLEWPSASASASPATLDISAGRADVPVTVLAELSYDIDRRESQAQGIGLSLQRDYAVLREGRWQPVTPAGLRGGDWVRVRLLVSNARLRHHVALSDALPGGLRPEDLSLQGVGGAVSGAQQADSYWFGTRQLADRQARFYATWLPPGSHEVIYYARAAYRGDYFAPPASAELMYGGASTARSAPARLSVE